MAKMELPEHVKRWQESGEHKKCAGDYERLKKAAQAELRATGKVSDKVMGEKAAAKAELRRIERKLNAVNKASLQRAYIDRLDGKAKADAIKRLGIG